MEVHTLYMSGVKESHRSAFADASKIENATKHIAEGIKMCVMLQFCNAAGSSSSSEDHTYGTK